MYKRKYPAKKEEVKNPAEISLYAAVRIVPPSPIF